MLTEALSHEGDADEDEEAQGEHFDRGVAVDEIADGSGKGEHDAKRDDDGSDHDPELFDHADGGDDRVEGEHDIEQEDLEDDSVEGDGFAGGVGLAVCAFELVVDFGHAFADQEKSAEEQDEVAAG